MSTILFLRSVAYRLPGALLWQRCKKHFFIVEARPQTQCNGNLPKETVAVSFACYSSSLRNCSGVLGDSRPGAISNTLCAPADPCRLSRYTARAYEIGRAHA